jgi:molybdate transport system regulatory protein
MSRRFYHAPMAFSVRPRIRVVRDQDDTILLGPGKADLLDAIARAGSLRGAADELGMSYMRAWNLVKTMNAAFRTPLVEMERGGPSKGGAQLTERGERVRALYREMETKAERAIAAGWKRLRREL